MKIKNIDKLNRDRVYVNHVLLRDGEVTPRVRHNNGWKTLTGNGPTLYKKWVKVKGWLTYDILHRGNAINTASSKNAIHRSTVWEIHPITSIEIVDAP